MASKRPHKKASTKRAEPRAAGPRRAFLEAQAATQGFKDGQAYLNHLIDEDRRRAEAARREFERLVREGLEGPWEPMDERWFAEQRALIREVAARARRRAG